MTYDSYQYLFPPRAERIVPPTIFPFFEGRGWTAECKKNGTSSVIFVPPSREPIFKTRHNTDHDLWEPSQRSREAFRNLPGSSWFVFCAELLHSKVKGGPRDTHYIHDCLVYDGQFQYGVPYRDRCALLEDLFLKGNEIEAASHHVVSDNVWLAKRFQTSFADVFACMNGPEDEGIVLKNPSAPLAFCTRPGQNSSWQAKSRRGTKVYDV